MFTSLRSSLASWSAGRAQDFRDRLFQSEALDGMVSLADLAMLSPLQLSRLAREVQQRLKAVNADLILYNHQPSGFGAGSALAAVHLTLGQAILELQRYLRFFAAQVHNQRRRNRRAPSRAPLGLRAVAVQFVA